MHVPASTTAEDAGTLSATHHRCGWDPDLSEPSRQSAERGYDM